MWRGDARLLEAWAAGKNEELIVLVAADTAQPEELLGVAMVQPEPDALNGRPSAHLEVLLVTRAAEGQGVGRSLITAAEEAAQAAGAHSMTLNVIATNRRAQRLYEKTGFRPEILRYIKHFQTD